MPNDLIAKTPVIFLLILFGCSTVEQEDVIGKWGAIDENDEYMELWFNDGQALSYLSNVEEVFIYDYTLRHNTLSFNLTQSVWQNYNHVFNLKIISISDTEMKIHLYDPSGKTEETIYKRISKNSPNISTDLVYSEVVKKEVSSRFK